MSFGITELVVQSIVQDGLANLRARPHHLQYILDGYTSVPYVAKRIGKDFVPNAIKRVLNEELTTRPYYTEDIDVYPCLVFSSSRTEDQEYLGDHAGVELLSDPSLTISPNVYGKFDASLIEGDQITVSSSYKLEETIFPGLYAVNGNTQVKVKAFQVGSPNSILHLEEPLPAGTTMKGWKVQTLPSPQAVILNASTDSVSVQMVLYTSGDMDLHRVYCQVVRYCLKRGRAILESYGIQNASFSMQPPLATDDKNLIFRTNFSMQAEETETWIEDDLTPVDGVSFETTADSDDPDHEEVEL